MTPASHLLRRSVAFVLFAALLLAPAVARALETCTNGVDDDADGWTDCLDPECATDVACPDVIRPSEVSGVRVTRGGADVLLGWDALATDALGLPERPDAYRAYRGNAPSFTPDMTGGSNRTATVTAPAATLTDPGAATDGTNHFYLLSAVDPQGAEGNTKPAKVSAPVLSGNWTVRDDVELAWTGALPRSQVWRYRVYYGTSSRHYDHVEEAGVNLRWAVYSLQPGTMYYFAVTALDRGGNETPFSNEIAKALNGTVTIRAMTQGHSVNGGPNPNNGWEPQAPVTFPPGNWTKVTMTLTLNSYLTAGCNCAGTGGCGGDEWDRLIEVVLVTDESCLGGRCAGLWDKSEIELMHAVTPFGTSARTGPRLYTMDVTPFAPLLVGTRWIGVDIVTWSANGYFSDVDFTFTDDPAQASPKPPAAGIVPLFFRDGIGAGNQAAIPPTSVTIPADARQVKARIFTTGHGGANSTGYPECSGNPADEFCMKSNQLLVDGAPAWQTVVWRDCSNLCGSWNGCGYPSCTYPRAGWCPGEIACPTNAPCDQDVDITAAMTPGTHDVSYLVVNPTPGGSWVYSAVLYWYR